MTVEEGSRGAKGFRRNTFGAAADSTGLGAVPEAYRDGTREAIATYGTPAAEYVAGFRIGDPLADAAIKSLAEIDPTERHRCIQECMDGDEKAMSRSPRALLTLFEAVESAPPWYDRKMIGPGGRALFQHADVFLAALVLGVIAPGLATTVGRPHYMTGRVVDAGKQRLRQNIRHLVEICLPGGLDRHGEGWKSTIRIRIVHAQVRRLLSRAGWETARFGSPIHAASLLFTAASFSALCLEKVRLLGGRLTEGTEEAYVHIWRYAAWLMGVPEDMLFHDKASALRIVDIGFACEPPPGLEGIAMANAIVNSAPLVIGVSDLAKRRKMARQLYRVSRSLIGNSVADQLRFPNRFAFGMLPALRFKHGLLGTLHRLSRGARNRRRARNTAELLAWAQLSPEVRPYGLPDHADHGLSSSW